MIEFLVQVEARIIHNVMLYGQYFVYSQGSVIKKLYELESKTLVLEERLHTSELLLQEKECLVDHLQ